MRISRIGILMAAALSHLCAGGWLNGYAYRKAITIDHTKVAGGGTLTNFPVLVSITDANLATGAQASGNDIVFTAGDGATKLAHEIEQYNGTTGQLIAWVNVPSISAASDTVVYLYYGNAGAANQQNAAGVWDTNYKGVWHLPNGTTLTTGDSTAGANGLTNTGGSAATAGEVGGGASFNGTTQSMSTSGALNFGGSKTGTVEFWLKPTTLSTLAIMLETSTNFNTNAGSILIDPAGEGSAKWGFEVSKGDSANYNGVYLNANPTTGAWHHIAMAIDLTAGTGQAVRVYVDGALASVTQNRASDLSGIALGNHTAYLMARNNSQYRQAGSLDEARVSNVARSAGWIGTEYANQSAPGTFYTVGAQESGSVFTGRPILPPVVF